MEGLQARRSRAIQDNDARYARIHPPLSHAVLPAGFHRIRYYGLLASGKRADNIARARELLTLPILPVDTIKAATINADEPSKGQFLTNWEKSRAHSGLLDPPGL